MLVLMMNATVKSVVTSPPSNAMITLLVPPTLAMTTLDVYSHPFHVMMETLVLKTGVAQSTDANINLSLAMITTNVRPMTAIRRLVVLTLQSTVMILICVLMIAVTLNAVVDTMMSLVKIIMNVQ
jgi:hypothetical protein